MTASRPDRQLRLKATLLGAAMGCALASFYPAQALQEEQEEQSAETATQTPEQEAAAKREAEARRRYYLGNAPKLKRQMGPALGSPRSILPQPYLPKGSVDVPPAPDGEAGDGMAVEMPGQQADDAFSSDTAVDADPQVYSDGTPITEGELDMIDPSGTAVLGPGEGFPRDFWAGRDRAYVLAALQHLATPSTSAALNDAARKIALSGMNLPAPSSEGEVDEFVGARLGLLAAYGDHEGYQALLNRLPGDRDWSGISRHVANGYLLAGRIEDTCTLAGEERSDDSDPYWLRIAAFCRAVRADRMGVDFQLGILEEAAAVKPTFYALLDQILIEAEQQAGGVMTAAPSLSAPLQVDVLEATMARLAKVTVPELSLEDVNPLAVDAMLSLPGVSQQAKISLMGEALKHGWVSGNRFAAFVQTLEISAEEGMAAFETAETDDRFELDIVFAAIAATSADADQRAAAARTLWQRSLARGTAQGIAAGLPQLMDRPFDLVIRAALLSGNTEMAANTFTSIRSNVAGANPAADQALMASWPLLTARGIVSAPEVTPERLEAWWALQADKEERFAHAGLLYAVLEALGHEVPDPLWEALDAGPVRLEGAQVAIGPWRSFLRSARDDDKAGALVAAFRLMERGDIPATLAGSLVGTMRDLGFRVEASQLAAEILVLQGL
jgi:hypothetical protein